MVKRVDIEYPKSSVFKSTLFIFFVVSILYSILAYLNRKYIYTDVFFYNNLSQDFSENSIKNILNIRSKFSLLEYIFIPFFLFFRILFSSVAISIGMILSKGFAQFKLIFKTVLKADLVFFVGAAVHSVTLYLNRDEISINNSPEYYPLSVINFLSIDKIYSDWIYYALQTINLFEFIFIFTVSILLSNKINENFKDTISVVLPSYGIGLFLWICLVSFLAFQLS